MYKIYCPTCCSLGTHSPGCPEIPDDKLGKCHECKEPIQRGEKFIAFEDTCLHPDCYAAMTSSEIMKMLGGKVVNG